MASPEYQVITEYRDLLVNTISQDPQGVADMLMVKFLISENLRDELGLQTLTKQAKARLVVDAMPDLVKQNSGNFDILISIFTSVGLWTGDLVTLLQKARRKCSGGSEFPALTLTVLTRELLTVTEPHLLGVGLGIEEHILETIVKNNKFDIEGHKMALFSYIANNHKRLNITWDDIASVLRDMLNKGNLALDIKRKIMKSKFTKRRRKSSGASSGTYQKMMEVALVPDPDQADQLPPASNGESDGRVGAVLHPPQNEETETLVKEAALVPDPDLLARNGESDGPDGRVGAVLHAPQNEETEALATSSLPTYFAYHHWKLDTLSDGPKGDNTLIAILGTGILSDHPVFSVKSVAYAINFVGENRSDYHDSDFEAIGTTVASVVAGRHIKCTPDTKKFVDRGDVLPVGVAPNASLIVCRVGDKRCDNNAQAVEKALQWIFDHNSATEKENNCCDCRLNHYSQDEATREKNKIRVVFLSFKFERNVLAIEDLIDDLKRQGVVCVASSDDSLPLAYPAAYRNVLSVSSNTSSDVSPRIDALTLGDDIVCACVDDPNHVQVTSGSSLAASAVTGLIALLLQCAREHATERVTVQRIMAVDVLRFIFKERLMEGDCKLLVPDKVVKFLAEKRLDSIVKNALGL